MKRVLLFFSLFILFAFATFSTSSLGQTCSGTELEKANDLRDFADECSQDISPSDLKAKKAAQDISTDAMQIAGQLGQLCPKTESANEILKHTESEINKSISELKKNNDLNIQANNAGVSSFGGGFTAGELFNQARTSLSKAKTNMMQIKKNTSEVKGTKCNLLTSKSDALSDDLDAIEEKLNEDLTNAENLQKKGPEVADTGKSVNGEATPSEAPTSYENSQENAQAQSNNTQEDNYASQDSSGNNGQQASNQQQPESNPGDASPGGNPSSGGNSPNSLSNNPSSNSNLFPNSLAANPDSEPFDLESSKPSAIDDYLAQSQAEREERLAALAEEEAKATKAQQGADPSLLPDTKAATYTHAPSVVLGYNPEGDKNEDPRNRTAANTNLLNDANRALASPPSSDNFQNLTVEEALQKINNIPIRKP